MLRLTNISKTFNPGTEDAKLALDNVSLHVRPGDFISIIGANGAGKSTLFGAIAGSFITDTGEIVLDGEDITLTPEYKRSKQIGRLFQDPMRGSAPGMTIEENLALAAGKGGWLHRLTKQEKKQLRERVALLGMGLEDRMSQPVGLLSGGQRQALTLMMATYNPPKLLLLDEHTAALDPGTAEKVLALTTKIVEENHLTCLMITHNMASALSLGNRTIMMDRGHIIHDAAGEKRDGLTVEKLLQEFREGNDIRITELGLEGSDPEKNPVIRSLFDGDLRESLTEAIASLPPKCREVFIMSYLEDMSNKEISAKLDISLSTVENHMYKALKLLRSALSGDKLMLFYALIPCLGILLTEQ